MDRFYRGFVAGIVGGIAMNIWSFISVNLLNFSQFHFFNWAAVMTFGSPAEIFFGILTIFNCTYDMDWFFRYYYGIPYSTDYFAQGLI